MLTLNTNSPFYDEDQWGQFIDIENHHLFPKQIIQYITTIKTETTTMKTETTIMKTETTTTTILPLKSILKKPIETQINVPKQLKQSKQIKINEIKPEEEEKKDDNRFQEFIERQLYVGWLICVLTFGLYLLP